MQVHLAQHQLPERGTPVGDEEVAHRHHADEVVVVVHDEEETVAIGAAIQAAAAYRSEDPASTGRSWSLASTRSVDPSGRTDGDAIRAAYMKLKDAMYP